MKSLFALLLTVVVVGSSLAQVTITAADVSARLTVGNSLVNRIDTLTTTANIGTPGSTANTWNFSTLATHVLDTLTSVAVSGTPYASWFPGATHALRTRQTLFGITGTVYQYLALSTNLLNPGAAGDGQTIFGTAILRRTNTPAEVFYQLPMTLGTEWTTTYVETLLVTVGGSPFVNQATNHVVRNTVDGFGTLTLPGTFGSHQALRIRRVDRYSGASTGATVSYQFIARNAASVQVTAADTLQPNSGVIRISPGSASWSGPLPTDVRISEQLPSEFALKQNYPNPFNPTTVIEYQVARAEFVSLKVYNLLGQEMATLVQDVKEPGTYAVQWNAESVPSGIYFAKMQAGTFTQTRRMMVVK
ncbi:MAG: hypothetical protein C4326_09865 [Ignavibacteria bacterium]